MSEEKRQNASGDFPHLSGVAFDRAVQEKDADLLELRIRDRIGLGNVSLPSDLSNDALLAALKHPDWRFRVAALRSLAHHEEDVPITILAEALYDEQEFVRVAALDVLAASREPAYGDYLADMLSDPAWMVRASAAQNLALFPQSFPIAKLIKASFDSHEVVRAAAVRTLGFMGEQAPKKLVVHALRDEEWQVREAAVLALKKLGEIEILVSYAKEEREENEVVLQALDEAIQRKHVEPEKEDRKKQKKNQRDSASSYVGKRFGNYKITAVIACGASGYIYCAHHVALGRVAALKLLRPDRPHSRAAHDQLLDEARLLDRLRHPHILPVYECGIDHDLPYLVMKYARGGSLRDQLGQRFYRPLPLADSLIILSQIGDALAYAHQLGVIHRDIKPENILFNTRGDAFLADVGIAVIQAPDELEQIVDGSGTPAYMPPEQFNGVVDARSDLYALGCTAYEMLTGHRPFNAPDHLAMAVKHAREHPVPPTLLNPKLPSRIDEVVLKALEKRRVNRYPDVRTFITELLACATALLPEPPACHVLFSSQQERKVEQLLDKGTRLYLAAYYAEALAAYNEALRLDAYCARAYLGRGNAFYKLQEYGEALVAYQLALRFDPYNAEYHNNRGVALRALGRYAEALAAYEQALRLNPTSSKALRGLSLVRQKQCQSRSDTMSLTALHGLRLIRQKQCQSFSDTISLIALPM